MGFFFSLGHSTIVFGLTFLLSIGVRALSGPVQNNGSTLHKATNVIGTTVSGSFLYLIAILNILILVSIVRIFLDMRRGAYNEEDLEEQLASRGLMNRFFGKRMNKITEPWQMYPLGVLFGLGFDTATEVALLVLAAGAGAAGLPFYAILCLPILFAAGMSLLDTIDGSFMNFAYGWAFSKPVRKVYYNITITGLSVVIALFIGTIELVGLVTDKLDLHGSVVNWLQNFNINTAGFIIVGMFVVTWTRRARRMALRADRGEVEYGHGAGRGTIRRGGARARRAGLTDAPQAAPLAIATIDEAIEIMREQGLRLSTPRRLILEALFAAPGPVSAVQISRELSIEITSVYRNLEMLEEHGLVRHVHLAHGPGLYVLVGRVEHEYLYCELCEKVTPVAVEELDPVRAESDDGSATRPTSPTSPSSGSADMRGSPLLVQPFRRTVSVVHAPR